MEGLGEPPFRILRKSSEFVPTGLDSNGDSKDVVMVKYIFKFTERSWFSFFLMFMLSHQCRVQGSSNCGILQSRNGEHGESFEDVKNMEKKKKMESINQMN